MQRQGSKDISRFFVAGINYKKTDAGIRGNFAISNDQYAKLLEQAPSYGLDELFILSTCNRTEIYGFAEDVSELIHLLCTQTEGDAHAFHSMAYIKSELDAIEHLYSVGAGLDSQILGDYEIVGQLKNAVKFSREHGFVGTFMDRMVNCALQSSKAIKNNTQLSGGTVSVSFAAVQYIKENIVNITNKKILLLGTGKIGRNTCKNIVDYLGTTNVTLINRTHDKARELADELGLRTAPIENLQEELTNSHIVLVATNATQHTITTSHLEHNGNQLIIDLSIPHNVDPSAKELSNIELVNVDDLSKLKDETLLMRLGEVPKAKTIITTYIQEFLEWYEMRKHVPLLKAVKVTLQEIHTYPLFDQYAKNVLNAPEVNLNDKIQRVINGMASKMRQQNQGGCQYIQAINEFIAPSNN
ncbi:glutamyl-tRNA reductase [Gynurincola endophyticus]|uniref:glutamyl-tRNA reductase n=1 Tax=Gynurincola endophyticus TaxID=2479004 RepID=UPI000F8DBBBB|nr:glutamyl-tRNA reductase [Gynurincola endophyticus]